MLKLTSVFLFMALFMTTAMPGQTLSKQPPSNQSSSTDLRQLFSKETEKLKKESTVFDAKKMEKASRQSMKNHLTKNQKIFLVLFIAGMAALVFLVIKYYKKCIRYRNNCDPAFDENCYCEEYEQREQAQQSLVPGFQRSVPEFGRVPRFNRKFSF